MQNAPGRWGGPLQTRGQGCTVACCSAPFVLIGIVIALTSFMAFASTSSLHRTHLTTTGTIGACTTSPGVRGGPPSTSCTVTYTVKGQSYTISSDASGTSGTTPVYYQPGNPSNALTQADFAAPNNDWIFGAFGIVFSVFGLLPLLGGISAIIRARRATMF